MRKEILVTVAMVAFVGWFWWMARSVEISDSTIFPRAVMGAMLVMCGLQLIQAILMGRLGMKHLKSVAERPAYRKVAIILACMVVYLAVMEYIGFYTSAFLFYILTVLILQKRAITPKVLLVRGGMAAGFTASLYLLFNVILSSQVPSGILF